MELTAARRYRDHLGERQCLDDRLWGFFDVLSIGEAMLS
jgi:hypothetical protein